MKTVTVKVIKWDDFWVARTIPRAGGMFWVSKRSDQAAALWAAAEHFEVIAASYSLTDLLAPQRLTDSNISLRPDESLFEVTFIAAKGGAS